MAISIEYKWDEASTSENLLDKSSTAALKFIVTGDAGVDTEFSAREALALLAPPLYGTLLKETVTILNRISDGGGEVKWDAEVRYANPKDKEQPKPKDESYVILEVRSGGGSTIQRTFSKELVEE